MVAEYEFYLYPTGDSTHFSNFFDFSGGPPESPSSILYTFVDEGVDSSFDSSSYMYHKDFEWNDVKTALFNTGSLPPTGDFHITDVTTNIRASGDETYPIDFATVFKDTNRVDIAKKLILSNPNGILPANGSWTSLSYDMVISEHKRHVWDFASTEVILTAYNATPGSHIPFLNISALEIIVAGTGDFGHWSHTIPLSVCSADHLVPYCKVAENNILSPESGDNYRFRGNVDWTGTFNAGYYPLEEGSGEQLFSTNGGPTGQFYNNPALTPTGIVRWFDGWDKNTSSDMTLDTPVLPIHRKGVSFIPTNSYTAASVPESGNSFAFDFGNSFNDSFSIYTSVAISGRDEIVPTASLTDYWTIWRQNNEDNNISQELLLRQIRSSGVGDTRDNVQVDFYYKTWGSGEDGFPVYSTANNTFSTTVNISPSLTSDTESEHFDTICIYNSDTMYPELWIRPPHQNDWSLVRGDVAITGRQVSNELFTLGRAVNGVKGLNNNAVPAGYYTEFGVADYVIPSSAMFDMSRAVTNHHTYIDEKGLSPVASGGTDTSFITHPRPNASGNHTDSITFELEDISSAFTHLNSFHNPVSSILIDAWIKHDTNHSGTLRTYINGIDWSGEPQYIPSGEHTHLRYGGTMTGSTDFINVNQTNWNNSTLTIDLEYPDKDELWDANFEVYDINICLDAWWRPIDNNQDVDLYITGDITPSLASGVDLFTFARSISNSGIDLFVSGIPNVGNTGIIDLYTMGSFHANSGTPLMISGVPNVGNTGDITFYTSAVFKHNSGVPLYVHNFTSSNSNLSLYVGGTDFNAPASSTTSFYTKGISVGVGGLFNTAPLNIVGADQETSGNLNLYLQVSDTADPTDETSDMNLFLKALGNEDGSQGFNNEVTMFVENVWVADSGGTPLTIWNQQGSATSGAIPISGNMNLFINRPFNSIAHNIPMHIAGPSGSTDTTSLFMQGSPNDRSGVDMNITGIGADNKAIQFYTSGF